MNLRGKDNYNSEKEIKFDRGHSFYLEVIEEYGTKINFNSNKEFIFSYSFVDYADYNFIEYKPWLEERKEVLSNLKINKVSDKNSNDNVLSINFNPNYKYSNTKYIIVITPKTEDYTEESLSNPCYIAKLVNDKKDGILIENWIDPGTTDTITAEVDIYDILDFQNNNYVVGIISQELRFFKNINFYSAKEFNHEARERERNKGGNNSGSKTLVIVLSIVGAVIVIAAILLIICILRKKRTGNNSFETKNEENKLLSDM